LIELQKIRLGDMCKFQNGYAFKSKDFKSDGQYKVVKIKELKNGKVKFFEDTATIDLNIDEYDNYSIYKGDVLFALTGDPVNKNNPLSWVGRVSIYQDNKVSLLNQRVCKIITDDKIIIKEYVYYYFRVFENFYFLAAKATGSASQANISTKTIADTEMITPAVETQRRIVKTLSSIDNKIANNNQINDNLEQQIQYIFNNMFPNMFPNIFKGSSDTLEKIISFSNGKKRPEEIGAVPVYGGNGILAYTRDSNSENCVIIGRVGAYCGNTYLCSGKCWVSDNAIQAKSKNSKSQLFIYYCLKNASLPSKHIGSGQPLMTQGILNSIQCVVPDEEKVEQFIIHCTPMQQLIDSNIEENDRLSELRDSLLPKLMSGELDISDIEF